MSTLRDMLAPALYRIPLPRREGRGSILAAASRLMPFTRRTVGVSVATHRYLLYVVLPTWLAAGFADYLFHRRTKIEQTSGPRESLIHWLMMTETGIPVLMGLFFCFLTTPTLEPTPSVASEPVGNLDVEAGAQVG
ncbi:MAG: hypothetical protein ACXVCT_20590 [Ktedonobacterales bacterium]